MDDRPRLEGELTLVEFLCTGPLLKLAAPIGQQGIKIDIAGINVKAIIVTWYLLKRGFEFVTENEIRRSGLYICDRPIRGFILTRRDLF